MDDNAKSFLEAFISADHQVWGRRLLPLSLSHIVQLSAINSPISPDVEPRELTRADVAMAVYILSRPHDQFGFGRTLPSRIPWGLRWHVWFGDLKKANRQLRAYIRDYWQSPQLTVFRGGGKDLGSHWCLARVASLSLHDHTLTNRELWTLPVGYLLHKAAAIEEIKSDDVRVAVVDDSVRERAREIKRRNDEALKKMQAAGKDTSKIKRAQR